MIFIGKGLNHFICAFLKIRFSKSVSIHFHRPKQKIWLSVKREQKKKRFVALSPRGNTVFDRKKSLAILHFFLFPENLNCMEREKLYANIK